MTMAPQSMGALPRGGPCRKVCTFCCFEILFCGGCWATVQSNERRPPCTHIHPSIHPSIHTVPRPLRRRAPPAPPTQNTRLRDGGDELVVDGLVHVEALRAAAVLPAVEEGACLFWFGLVWFGLVLGEGGRRACVASIIMNEQTVLPAPF